MRRGDRLNVLENVVREMRRQPSRGGMSRRQFVRTSGGLIVAVAAPVTLNTACGVDPSAIVQVIFALTKLAIAIGEIVAGDMAVTNPNGVCRLYDVAVSLEKAVSGGGGGPIQTTLEKQICEGETVFPLEDWALAPNQSGSHLLSTIIDGTAFTSDPFEVNA